MPCCIYISSWNGGTIRIQFVQVKCASCSVYVCVVPYTLCSLQCLCAMRASVHCSLCCVYNVLCLMCNVYKRAVCVSCTVYIEQFAVSSLQFVQLNSVQCVQSCLMCAKTCQQEGSWSFTVRVVCDTF